MQYKIILLLTWQQRRRKTRVDNSKSKNKWKYCAPLLAHLNIRNSTIWNKCKMHVVRWIRQRTKKCNNQINQINNEIYTYSEIWLIGKAKDIMERQLAIKMKYELCAKFTNKNNRKWKENGIRKTGWES